MWSYYSHIGYTGANGFHLHTNRESSEERLKRNQKIHCMGIEIGRKGCGCGDIRLYYNGDIDYFFVISVVGKGSQQLL